MNKTPVIRLYIKAYLKKFFISLPVILLTVNSSSQDIRTLVKLNEACVQLGSSRKLPADSLQLEMSFYRVNIKIAQHLEFLLKAAEYYLSGDYEHSDYYINQVHMNFRNMEYNNLKLLLMTCNFAHDGDVKNAARHYYIIRKINQMETGNMELIYKEIAGNLTREDFDNELSHYFYYHQRLKILDTIYDTKVSDNQ
jgi:hypothetical protein